VWGVDSSETSLAQTERRVQGRAGWQGATRAVPQREFDAITCIETIEHLPGDVLSEMLADIRSHLSVGGAVLLTTPNDEDIRADPVYCPFCDHEFHPMQHVRSFSAASLRGVLEQADFEVSFCEPVHLMEFQAFRPRRDTLRYSAHQVLLKLRTATRLPVDAKVPRPHLVAIARRVA
jgi:cyclopropane fatty-acyl-phospholipid synthase-like methyltransferase